MLLAAAASAAGGTALAGAGKHAARTTAAGSAAAAAAAARSLPPSVAGRRHRHHHPPNTRAASSSSSRSTPATTPPQPQRPLCRRLADHLAPLADLLAWRAEALEGARRLAAQPATQLGADAPTERELARELGWVLEDAVGGVVVADVGGDGAEDRGRRPRWSADAGWREIAAEVLPPPGTSGGGGGGEAKEAGAVAVRLRAPLAQLRALWRRRLEERAPHQYLIATAHWRDLVLSVGPGVLVPRPETEMMVDLAEAALARQEEQEDEAAAAAATTPTRALPPPAWRPWADLGTGSGAIAIALARMLLQRRRRDTVKYNSGNANEPQATTTAKTPTAPAVFAVDRSAAAAAYARHNARVECGLAESDLLVLEGSWLAPLRERGIPPRSLGGILSNPPYIPRREMQGLQAEVGGHEPASALDGGAGEGLDSLREVVREAAGMLAPGGFLALETAGGGQARLVAGLLEGEEEEEEEVEERGGGGKGGGGGRRPVWRDVELVDDCYGRDGRFVTAYRT